ncbi:MAG: hypothetical protein RL199_464 [Pseudomonadota bacterium]|jgi:hypothetical protein
MRQRLWTNGLLALTLGGCGAGPAPGSGSGAGAPTATVDPARFGLADGRCWRYALTPGGPVDLTLFVEADTTAVRGLTTYHVTMSDGLAHKVEWWLEPTSNDLLLHRRREVEPDDKGRDVDSYFIYRPAPVWLREGLATGVRIDSETTVTVTGARNGDEPATVHLLSLGPATVVAPGVTGDATSFVVERDAAGKQLVDKVWFFPGVGIVKIDPFGADIGPRTLVESSVLAKGETCL